MNLHKNIIREALEDPNRNIRLDKLSNIVILVRERKYQIQSDEAQALYEAQLELTKHLEVFDDLTYRVIWELIEYAPPYEPIKALAEIMLSDPRPICRGNAIMHLLRSYPALKQTLIEKHEEDKDPYVQDALARFLIDSNPREAVRHWRLVLEAQQIGHDLAESVPVCLGELGNEKDLEEYETRDLQRGGGTLWGMAAALIRSKSK